MRTIVVCATLSVFAAAISFNATSYAGGVRDPDADSDQRLVCRRERQTGSHMKRRVCRTVAQIEAEREDAAEFIRNSNREDPVRKVDPQVPKG
jgi:hypothetical protein